MYYRHSNELNAPRTIVTLTISVAVALAAGAAYGWAVQYAPAEPELFTLVILAFGAIVGAVTAGLLRWACVRNRLIYRGVAIGIPLLAWYASWAMWVGFILRRSGYIVSYPMALAHPLLVFDVARNVNEGGTWSIVGHTPTGLILWLLWIVEAAFILGIAISIALKMNSDEPYCESCQAWCARTGGFRIAMVDLTELLRRLEAQDATIISEFRQPDSGSSQWLRLELSGCQKCNKLHTLTVKTVTEKTNPTKATPFEYQLVMKRLLLAPGFANQCYELEKKWDLIKE